MAAALTPLIADRRKAQKMSTHTHTYTPDYGRATYTKFRTGNSIVEGLELAPSIAAPLPFLVHVHSRQKLDSHAGGGTGSEKSKFSPSPWILETNRINGFLFHANNTPFPPNKFLLMLNLPAQSLPLLW